MPAPKIRGVAHAAATVTTTGLPSPSEDVNLNEVASRAAKKFGKANALLNAATGAPRSSPARKDAASGLQDRQSCASGTQFYHCANGFLGCCSVNPCNPGGGCPDEETSSTAPTTATVLTTAVTSSSQDSTADATTSIESAVSASSAPSNATVTSARLRSGSTAILTATSSTGNDAASGSATSVTAAATPAPSCPSGNGTTFTDSSSIAYKIHCNADNSYPSLNTTTVGTGGYQECFSACSGSSTCAGFTYVGLDGGSCYLKGAMPDNNFVAKNGTNYVSCAKLNATAALPLPGTSNSAPAAGKKTSTGAIAGGIVGGIAGLALILLLIALIAKHRRKKVEERRATITHIHHGPIETQPMKSASPTNGGHARSGSTAHDAFAPFGGFYRGFSSSQADRQAKVEALMAKEHEDGSVALTDMPPGIRAESKNGAAKLPSTTYKQHPDPPVDAVAMLDSTPIKRPLSQASGSRSPRFYEHIAEMEDTSSHPPPLPMAVKQPSSPSDTDSPTLGRDTASAHQNGTAPRLVDDVRRTQHLMSWNNYDAGHANNRQSIGESMATVAVPKEPPGSRQGHQVSPDTSDAPRDSKFVVSSMGSIDRGRPSS